MGYHQEMSREQVKNRYYSGYISLSSLTSIPKEALEASSRERPSHHFRRSNFVLYAFENNSDGRDFFFIYLCGSICSSQVSSQKML